MDKPLTSLDWSLVQAFLTVAEKGSLSAAARDLGSSQPTLGRQIKTLEAQLGAELFHRQARGLALTQTGADLVVPARKMRAAMQQIALTAAGQQARLEGTVRITASMATSIMHLPPIIARIRKLEPEIAIELVPSDDSRNLLYREADIAVRMYRPTQLDLVTQHLGDIPLGVFAAKAYLAAHGTPRTIADLSRHAFVGYDANPDIIDGFAQMGIKVSRDFFKVRVDDNIAYWEMVRAGCGIGFAQKGIGRSDPLIEEITVGIDLPVLPVWLTAHEAMRQTPRIRRVWDLLADGLRPLVS
ncbi:LysR family transcriptional regulator [Yoonia sediminilitoris]|uniref:LysR family transcriptional regulator n=1 Tax=Yoonia sediminilitoris TaxID=1286148 RepID=A0A2T6K878_9RHOB|nr:LysR family transcriptional regulator [Yoonia sediminilitoris]PUB10898.1 LysR family transcriptional regulator [Yoonia sediminilitoris]RCW90573.1 LysR family transcriptional regulator [Yoonia sediminilitoris]